jgi:uncharacterized membrane protein
MTCGLSLEVVSGNNPPQNKKTGELMKNSNRKISLVVVFAALYAVAVIFLAPISFSIYQVRVADALLPLSMIFGIPSALGFGLGTMVSNIYGGLGPIDIVGGTMANIIACSLAWYIAKRGGITYRFVGSIIVTIVISTIVGGYLSLIFDVPLEFGLFGVLVGSIIAVNTLGFPILEIIRRNKAIKEYANFD